MELLALNSEGRNILLVEDEELTAKLEIKLLKSYQYEVFHVKSGEEALDFMKKNYAFVDLILMDIDLGNGIDGTETARRILQTYNIPILFLSSHTEKDIVEKTEKVTSYGYVVKNSGITVLDASIKMAFKLFFAHKEITENYQKLKKLTEELEKKEKELRISEAKFHNAFYYSPAVLVISSLEDGKILEVNAAWTEILGFTHEESVGKTFIELGISTQETRQKFLSEFELQKVLKNREYSLKNKYEEIKHFQYCSVVHEIDGKKYLFSSAIDITAEKNIRDKIIEHQREFEQVFENSPNLFFKCDRMGIITKFLAGRHSNLYVPPEIFLGKPISNVFPPHVAEIIMNGLEEAFLKNRTVSVEYPLVLQDEVKYFQAALTPMEKDKAFAIVQEITEQKNHEIAKERLLRFYNFSHKINEFLITSSKENLWETICQIAIKYGNFIFAWVGILEENQIIPKYFEGKEERYLNFLESISLESPIDKKGPTATAITQGEIIFCNDIETDPRMEKWRQEALKRGYLSSVAIPFHSKKVSGTLNLYSNKKNIFFSQELEILKELQNSLNFVLERLD